MFVVYVQVARLKEQLSNYVPKGALFLFFFFITLTPGVE